MKKYILIFLLILPLFVFGQYTWNYPINENTDVWNKMTYEEQINSYNIPNDLLSKISTKDLLYTCLNYPEWRLINAYNDINVGFVNVLSMFNGFQELFQRKDVTNELFSYYEKQKPLNIKTNCSDLEKGQYAFKII